MNWQTFTTNNNRYPKEGPKTLPVFLEFSGVETRAIDLLLPVQQGKISVVQGVLINNFDGPDIELIVDEVDQRLTIKAGAQGSYQLLTPENPRFTINANGPGAVRLHFVNFPILTATF